MTIENGNLILNIKSNEIRKTIKKTKKILKLCDDNNLKLIIKLDNKKLKKSDSMELYNVVCAINIKNIEERYSFIYDVVCDYIDKKYMECNYCDFKDNKCAFMRHNKYVTHEDGCCYSDARGGLCKHLEDHHCNIKAISCKLYSCEYLRKRKVYFKIKDIPLLKYFFSLKQKYYLKYSFFKNKTYVMYKLIGVYNEKKRDKKTNQR